MAARLIGARNAGHVAARKVAANQKKFAVTSTAIQRDAQNLATTIGDMIASTVGHWVSAV